MRRTKKYRTSANAEKGKRYWSKYWEERGYTILSAEIAWLPVRNSIKQIAGVNNMEMVYLLVINLEEIK